MRIIAHLDMDAFFAAVEERDNPRFAGLPIVVGSDPAGGRGRGVVSTANYRARAYGIRSALPISKAWECAERARKEGKPRVVFLGVSMDCYAAVSARVRAVILNYAEAIEQSSIDEFFIDLSSEGDLGKAERTASRIKEAIRKKEKLTCSVGIGPNKLVAKIASDFRKPDGMTVVPESGAAEFLAPLPVRAMPGVGPKSEAILRNEGILTIGDIASRSRAALEDLFGKWGGDMHDHARGKDEAPVTEAYETKSIGEQETLMKDTRDAESLTGLVQRLSAEVYARFEESGFKSFRTVALTVRFSDFETKSRAHTMPAPVRSGDALAFEALKLFLPFLDRRENPGKKAIRLLGVRVEKLE